MFDRQSLVEGNTVTLLLLLLGRQLALILMLVFTHIPLDTYIITHSRMVAAVELFVSTHPEVFHLCRVYVGSPPDAQIR